MPGARVSSRWQAWPPWRMPGHQSLLHQWLGMCPPTCVAKAEKEKEEEEGRRGKERGPRLCLSCNFITV